MKQLVDGWSQTDPVRVIPLLDAGEEPIKSSALIVSSITPIYKSRKRKSKDPRKLLSQVPEVDKNIPNGFDNAPFLDTIDIVGNIQSPSSSNDSKYMYVNQPKRRNIPVIKSTLDEESLKGRFKCLLCPYANNHKLALELHSVIHETLPPFKCRKCSLVVRDIISLNSHIKEHTGEQKYVCQHAGCDYTSNNSSNMKRHSKSHVRSTRQSHEQPPFIPESSTSPVGSGSNSPDRTPKSSALLSHLINVVNGISTRDISSLVRDDNSIYNVKPDILKCDQCDVYQTESLTNLKRHKIRHRTHHMHKCPACAYTTNYLGNMKRHYEIRHKSEEQATHGHVHDSNDRELSQGDSAEDDEQFKLSKIVNTEINSSLALLQQMVQQNE